MTHDKTESLIREAVTEQAGRAVDGSVVIRALQRERPRRSMALVFAAVAVVVVAASAVVIPQLMRRDQAPPAAPGVVEERTILVLGRDGESRTDTIMLTRLAGERATAISVPRDTLVDIPGFGPGKVNSAFSQGREAALAAGASQGAADKTGAELTMSVVGGLTGMEIDDYLLIDMAAIGRAADAVGGVEVCVRSDTRDPLAQADFRAGRSLLTGPDALAFVRQRRGLPNGDLDRIMRQQVFLSGLIGRVTPANAAGVLAAVRDHVVTDADLLGLVESLARTRGGVRVALIPVDLEVSSPQGAGLEVSPEVVRPFVQSALAGEAPAAPDCVD
ncbi:LCP family protein [Actinokineospora xionganensis]|uniref:LCP family protein n=1 Tax=Actinokineospora xionganensis TaxID=2684470 RepID=A0ABR7LD50_9PSEU|nr:LCP family protein [Actinokineospora xionganensis]MBC6450513.1 LCP family protein [Actinokineospora xionganensis]